MIRQEPLFHNQKTIGVLRSAEWGVVFDPVGQHPAFNKARLKTWETVDAGFPGS